MNVFEFQRDAIMDRSQVSQLIPLLNRIAKAYDQRLNEIQVKIDRLVPSEFNQPAESLNSKDLVSLNVQRLEKQANDLIEEWKTKVSKLGGHSKGLWLVDFDSGDGYFCWKYPEPELLYWHAYSDGFTRRQPLSGSDLNQTSNAKPEQFL